MHVKGDLSDIENNARHNKKMGLKQMIKKLGTKYRIKCAIGAAIFAAIGITGVAAAMGADEESI